MSRLSGTGFAVGGLLLKRTSSLLGSYDCCNRPPGWTLIVKHRRTLSSVVWQPQRKGIDRTMARYCPAGDGAFDDWVESCPECGRTLQNDPVDRSQLASSDEVVWLVTAPNEPEAQMWANALRAAEHAGLCPLGRAWRGGLGVRLILRARLAGTRARSARSTTHYSGTVPGAGTFQSRRAWPTLSAACQSRLARLANHRADGVGTGGRRPLPALIAAGKADFPPLPSPGKDNLSPTMQLNVGRYRPFQPFAAWNRISDAKIAVLKFNPDQAAKCADINRGRCRADPRQRAVEFQNQGIGAQVNGDVNDPWLGFHGEGFSWWCFGN